MHIKYLRLVTDYTISWDTVIEKWSMNTFHNIDMYNFDSRKVLLYFHSTHIRYFLCISDYQERLKNLWNITLLISNY